MKCIEVEPDHRGPLLLYTPSPQVPLINDDDIKMLRIQLEKKGNHHGMGWLVVEKVDVALGYTPHLKEFLDLYNLVEKCMLGYIKFFQKDYPSLKHYKLSVLKSYNAAHSQYEGCNYRLHSDYHHHVNVRPPNQRPISVLVALDEFEFLYLKD